MSAPEFEPLPDPLSDGPSTRRERELLAECAAPDIPVGLWMLRALRAGHVAGRRSVLDTPPRVYRAGDPAPDHPVLLIDDGGDVWPYTPGVTWQDGWAFRLETYGPLVETVDYQAAVEADEKRRAEQ